MTNLFEGLCKNTPLWKCIVHEEYGCEIDFKMWQTDTFYYEGVQMYFGPLSTYITELFADGYELIIEDMIRKKHGLYDYNKLVSLKLKRGRETYTIVKKPLTTFIKSVDLVEHVKDNKNYLLTKHVEEPIQNTLTFKETMPTVLFDKLQQIYPIPKEKKDVFIGNMTLEEYVKFKLKENIK